MLIYEKQYEIDNHNNYQERTINSYSDFKEYIEYLSNDRSKELYPSLPRQAQIYRQTFLDDEIHIEFLNSVIGKRFVHIGKVVK